MKINTVAVYVQLGLGTGIQPLIGYNYGAVIVSYAVCIAYIRKIPQKEKSFIINPDRQGD